MSTGSAASGRRTWSGAIQLFEQALTVYTREAFPEQWARATWRTPMWAGSAASGLRPGACDSALRAGADGLHPQDWARTQGNLANAYADRIRGERSKRRPA